MRKEGKGSIPFIHQEKIERKRKIHWQGIKKRKGKQRKKSQEGKKKRKGQRERNRKGI